MDLLDRLLGHDAWTTRQLLDICGTLSDQELDRDFDIGHRTLRATLDHIIHNMEGWSLLMKEGAYEREIDRTIPGMMDRLTVAAERLRAIARQVADANDWDATWTDHHDPPIERTYGATIAHVITHSMHHRAQVLYMLRLTGVQELPEGDVLSWEGQLGK